MPRFSANLTLLFNEVPFLDRFDAAARAGFDAVEFMSPYEHSTAELARAARDADVEIVLFNAPPGDPTSGEFGLAALPGRERDLSKSVDVALDYARALNCKRIHMPAGLIDRSDVNAQVAYRNSLETACRAASPYGVDILIEPINGRTRPGYFLDDFSTAERMIAGAGRANLKLQFDVFHRQILHGDVTHALKRLLPRIGHIQVASVPARHEPNTGELDDARIFALLDNLRYQGVIGAEYHPQGATVAGLAWFRPYGRR